MNEAPQRIEKLNRSQPYGVVVGDPKIGFEQRGMHFDHQGKFVASFLTEQDLQNEVRLREEQRRKEDRLAARRAKLEANRILKEAE